MGNPFLDQPEELLTLDMGNVLNESVIETVCTIESLGKEQFKSYILFVDRTCSIHEGIIV